MAAAILGGLLYTGREAFFLSPALRAQHSFTEGAQVYVRGEIAGIEKKEKQTVLTVKKAEIKEVPDEGKSAEEPERKEKKVKKEKLSSGGLKCRGLLLYVKECGTYSIGETILGKGTLQFIEPPGNPGQFHAENYYRAKGID